MPTNKFLSLGTPPATSARYCPDGYDQVDSYKLKEKNSAVCWHARGCKQLSRQYPAPFCEEWLRQEVPRPQPTLMESFP